jgi:hypothetical protein
MKIVHVETVLSCGTYAKSKHWAQTRKALHTAIKKCAWPPGSRAFTIYPESGKRRGEGNGVGPIRLEFVKELRDRGWTIEGAAKNQVGQDLGDFDAVLLGPSGPVVAEWETGNVSSSHRSMNKLTMLASLMGLSPPALWWYRREGFMPISRTVLAITRSLSPI